MVPIKDLYGKLLQHLKRMEGSQQQDIERGNKVKRIQMRRNLIKREDLFEKGG